MILRHVIVLKHFSFIYGQRKAEKKKDFFEQLKSLKVRKIVLKTWKIKDLKILRQYIFSIKIRYSLFKFFFSYKLKRLICCFILFDQ